MYNNQHYNTRNKNSILISHHHLEMFKMKPSHIGTKFLCKLPRNVKEERKPNMLQKKVKVVIENLFIL